MKINYTDNQKAIIHSSGDARIDAVAGSGKTSTLIAYAMAHADQRLLFLSFNRSIAEDARRKFRAAGCWNVRVETMHSLAFKEMGVGRTVQLAKGGCLTVQDIIGLCGLKPIGGSAVIHLVLAKHIQKFLSEFCNSAERDIRRFDYLARVKSKKSKESGKNLEGLIYDYAESIFDLMNDGNIPVTHDAYLKFYHLTYPFLPYDSILLDEGQDSSPVTLAILTAQEQSTKICAGDSNQQIYSFRSAINSLESLDFPQFSLPHSFRFTDGIAKVAIEILKMKKHLGDFTPPEIVGLGPGKCDGSRGVISRTNMGLMGRAIEIMEDEPSSKMYFEGDLGSYTFMSDGASLYDLLALSLYRRSSIRSHFVKQFLTIDALQEYVEASGDQEVGLGLKLIEKYGSDLFGLMDQLKDRQVDRSSADCIFSTVHKSKGFEYDEVFLSKGDFISDSVIMNNLSRARRSGDRLDPLPMIEEINALYVAATRAKNSLHFNFRIGAISPPGSGR